MAPWLAGLKGALLQPVVQPTALAAGLPRPVRMTAQRHVHATSVVDQPKSNKSSDRKPQQGDPHRPNRRGEPAPGNSPNRGPSRGRGRGNGSDRDEGPGRGPSRGPGRSSGTSRDRGPTRGASGGRGRSGGPQRNYSPGKGPDRTQGGSDRRPAQQDRPRYQDLGIMELMPETLLELAGKPATLLQAPPGAGKSTGLPLAVMDAAPQFLQGKKIVMLQPRRLAARAAAQRMAFLLNERLGFATKSERVGGPNMQVEVITEGILLRRVQRDRELSDVGLVIIDEFHERNMLADLALAITLQSMRTTAPNLRLLVMSATLEDELIASLKEHVTATLGLEAPPRCVMSFKKPHPVTIEWMPFEGKPPFGGIPDRRMICNEGVPIIMRAFEESKDNVLVFLPGAGVINAVRDQLEVQRFTGSTPDIFCLYGAMTKGAQDDALVWEPGMPRRIILSTAIAETSLSVPGVRAVVDFGLARQPSYELDAMGDLLHTVHTSQASAAQRAGRAGRLGPGVCYRTWSDKVHERRNVVDEPAILREDPLPAVVEAAVWGDATLAQNMLPLLTRPRKARWQKAIERLLAMRVLRREGNGYEIMDQARAEGLAMLPVAPHCAHMILEARELGLEEDAAILAAVLEASQPIWRNRMEPSVDIREQVELVRAAMRGDMMLSDSVNRSGLREATQNAKLLLQRLRSLPVLEAPASDEADPSADFDEARLAAGTQSRLQKLRDAAEIPAATEITGDDLLIGEGNGAEVEASKPKRKKGKKRKGKAPENVDPDLLINPGCPAGLLLSFAFPTRVARRHTAERDCFTLPHDGSIVRLEDDENLNGAPRLVIPRIAPGRVEPPKRPQKTPRKGYTPPKPKPAKPVVSLAAPLTAAEAVKHAHSKLRVTYDVNWSTSQKRAMILEVLEINRIKYHKHILSVEEAAAAPVDAQQKAYKKMMLEFGKAQPDKVLPEKTLPKNKETQELALQLVYACGSFNKLRERRAGKFRPDGKEAMGIVARRLKAWGTPRVLGYVSSFDELRKLDWDATLRKAIQFKQPLSPKPPNRPKADSVASVEAPLSLDALAGASSDEAAASDEEVGNGAATSGFLAEAPPEVGSESDDDTDADDVMEAFREVMGGAMPRAYSEYR